MVAERVKLPTTAAPARRQRQGEPETAQQEDAKEGTGHGDVILCGRDIVKTRAAKGPVWESSTQRARCGSEVRKVHLVRALIASVGGEPLPAFEGPSVRRGRDGVSCR